MELIHAKNLTKVYRTTVKEPGLRGTLQGLFRTRHAEKIAVDNVSFSMEKGQAMACIGENGAGKSTLIKMMIGILHPTAGDLQVYGRPPIRRSKEYLRKIGVIFGQKSNLWVDIPVIESYNAMKTLYKIDPAAFKKNFDTVVELLDLGPILQSPARKLSLGQRMKADIGLVFLHSPEILFLDEPTIGLDINVKYAIRSFVRQMNRETGVSVFLTSHDLDDIDEICDDALVLSSGKLFYQGSLEKLKHSYASGKTVTVLGRKTGDIQALLPLCTVKAEERKTTIAFANQDYPTQQVLDAVFRSFTVEDLTIAEPDIDHVVSRIFREGSGI